ncbi:MAG: ABC transporter substrate-binding protein [Spirochaetia bacterium]|jgi:raffinose/stachyose/melibiose transport system substrate-binding protein|nr:ABC transporter substrate-binding protein [Spirochaetia bacterium]
MKKMFVGMLLALLIPCSTVFANGSSEQSKTAGPVVLKFIHKFPEPQRLKCFNEIVAGFEEENPEIKIDMTAYGDEEIKDKTRVLLGSDQAPDVFFTWSGQRVQQYVDSSVALDITKYLDADPTWKDSFNQSMLNCTKKEGSYWGVPFDYSSKEMIYNKKIFAKYNISIPTTWKEFLAVCQTLKENDIIPIAVGNQYPWVICHYLTTLNTKLVPQQVLQDNYALKDSNFTDAGYVQAYDMLLDLYNKGYMNHDVNSCTYEMSESLVIEGKAAMCYDETQILSKYEEAMGDDWGYFDFPEIEGARGEKGYITGGPDVFMINSSTKYPEEAVKFIKYLTSKKVQAKICKDMAFLPVVKGAANSENSLPETLEIIKKNNDAPGIAEWLDCVLNQTVANEYLVGCQDVFNGVSPEKLMVNVSEVANQESN